MLANRFALALLLLNLTLSGMVLLQRNADRCPICDAPKVSFGEVWANW